MWWFFRPVEGIIGSFFYMFDVVVVVVCLLLLWLFVVGDVVGSFCPSPRSPEGRNPSGGCG